MESLFKLVRLTFITIQQTVRNIGEISTILGEQEVLATSARYEFQSKCDGTKNLPLLSFDIGRGLIRDISTASITKGLGSCSLVHFKET